MFSLTPKLMAHLIGGGVLAAAVILGLVWVYSSGKSSGELERERAVNDALKGRSEINRRVEDYPDDSLRERLDRMRER
jgi:hypothetical protein